METYSSTISTVWDAVMFPAANARVRDAESGIGSVRLTLVEKDSGNERHLCCREKVR